MKESFSAFSDLPEHKPDSVTEQNANDNEGLGLQIPQTEEDKVLFLELAREVVRRLAEEGAKSDFEKYNKEMAEIENENREYIRNQDTKKDNKKASVAGKILNATSVAAGLGYSTAYAQPVEHNNVPDNVVQTEGLPVEDENMSAETEGGLREDEMGDLPVWSEQMFESYARNMMSRKDYGLIISDFPNYADNLDEEYAKFLLWHALTHNPVGLAHTHDAMIIGVDKDISQQLLSHPFVKDDAELSTKIVLWSSAFDAIGEDPLRVADRIEDLTVSSLNADNFPIDKQLLEKTLAYLQAKTWLRSKRLFEHQVLSEYQQLFASPLEEIRDMVIQDTFQERMRSLVDNGRSFSYINMLSLAQGAIYEVERGHATQDDTESVRETINSFFDNLESQLDTTIIGHETKLIAMTHEETGFEDEDVVTFFNRFGGLDENIVYVGRGVKDEQGDYVPEKILQTIRSASAGQEYVFIFSGHGSPEMWSVNEVEDPVTSITSAHGISVIELARAIAESSGTIHVIGATCNGADFFMRMGDYVRSFRDTSKPLNSGVLITSGGRGQITFSHIEGRYDDISSVYLESMIKQKGLRTDGENNLTVEDIWRVETGYIKEQFAPDRMPTDPTILVPRDRKVDIDKGEDAHDINPYLFLGHAPVKFHSSDEPKAV